MVPSEVLAFNARGKEILRQWSITEDKLWRKIKESNSTRVRGELPDPELEEELPPFVPIPMDTPGEEEVIHEKDVDMNPELSKDQKMELWATITKFMDVFTKGSKLGKVTSYKAPIKMDGKLPPLQHTCYGVHDSALVTTMSLTPGE